MFHTDDVGHPLKQMQGRIRELEAELAALKGIPPA
jgi:hypothetical protein